MNDEFTALRESVISTDSPETPKNRVVAAIADLGRYIAERDAEQARENEQRAREDAERAAERDRQIHNHITIGIGLIIGAITIATAVISIVIVVID